MNDKAMSEKISVGEVLRDISKIQNNVNENYYDAFDDEVFAVSEKLIENNLTAYMELAK